MADQSRHSSINREIQDGQEELVPPEVANNKLASPPQSAYKGRDSQYVSITKRQNVNCCRQFLMDFPYSLFKQRRKDPVTKMHVLKGQKMLDHGFEERFWDFDNGVIAIVQYFHMSQTKTIPGKLLGGLLTVLSFLLSVFFQLELWMCLILTLSMYQQDYPAHLLCHCMILNILVTQGIKRLFYRKRPGDFQPPRALTMIAIKKQGGCPSSMIVAATTFVYVCCATDSWISHLDGFNSIPVWGAWLIAVATFICVSFAKVFLGQNYPSDCILSIPPILLVITLFYVLQWLDSIIDLCPTCLDANDNQSFCYYDSAEISDK